MKTKTLLTGLTLLTTTSLSYSAERYMGLGYNYSSIGYSDSTLIVSGTDTNQKYKDYYPEDFKDFSVFMGFSQEDVTVEFGYHRASNSKNTSTNLIWTADSAAVTANSEITLLETSVKVLKDFDVSLEGGDFKVSPFLGISYIESEVNIDLYGNGQLRNTVSIDDESITVSIGGQIRYNFSQDAFARLRGEYYVLNEFDATNNILGFSFGVGYKF